MRSTPLSEAMPGVFRVVAVMAGRELTGRLEDLGLHVGDLVDVLGNQGTGGTVVGRGDTRLALDQTTASKVRVVAAVEKK